MEAKNFLLPGRKQKEGQRSVPSTIVIGLYGRPDRQWQFNTNSKWSFRHTGENSRQCKVLFIMRSPEGNALPIKALSLLASLSASSTYDKIRLVASA